MFKKSAQNNKITLYLGSRDVVISDKSVDKIQGVIHVDPDYLQDKKVHQPKWPKNQIKIIAETFRTKCSAL